MKSHSCFTSVLIISQRKITLLGQTFYSGPYSSSPNTGCLSGDLTDLFLLKIYKVIPHKILLHSLVFRFWDTGY